MTILKTLKQKKVTIQELTRYYLPSGINISLLYFHWNNEIIKNNLEFSSFGKYYFIFTTKFNLGFVHPRQYVCSYCVGLEDKIKNETNEIKKNEFKEKLSAYK